MGENWFNFTLFYNYSLTKILNTMLVIHQQLLHYYILIKDISLTSNQVINHVLKIVTHEIKTSTLKFGMQINFRFFVGSVNNHQNFFPNWNYMPKIFYPRKLRPCYLYT